MLGVLESDPPRFSADEVGRIAMELFGVCGEVQDLGSERDQTFAVGMHVLKISNAAEDPAVLDLEARAIAHVLRVDPELPVARLLDTKRWDGHFVRSFERLRGEGGAVDVRSYALTHARLNLALRSFFHPAAGRELLWDLAHTPKLRAHLHHVPEPRRPLVEAVLARFEEHVAPRWPHLRAQAVHGDLNLDNVLLDARGRIAGIVDFGDMTYTAQVADFAVALASLMRGRPPADVFRVARLALDGYLPLEPVELEVLADLVAARLAAIVVISAWRSAQYPENAAYIQAWDDDSWALLEAYNPEGWARELAGVRPLAPTADLARRRAAMMGTLLTPLTYADPVHVVRGEGAWLYDANGRRLLDAYNNVPVVGHCHPRVTEAVVRQTRALNTHARYLYEPLVELAERLLATMPPAAGLDTVMLVNSGSEANDVAWRIATGVTGNDGALVTHHAYHGVTAATADLSPEEWPAGPVPAHVTRLPDRPTRPLAATFVDAGLTSDGVYPPTPERLQALVRATHEAGGLYVADEVQVGYGRSGGHLWGFAALGGTPDVVTLGKPMGNGYPVAAVITRRELVERFSYAGTVFSTFGGNPVAAGAALAVLDVIEDERLVEHAREIGALLRARIEALGLQVRSFGLLLGVQLESPERARAVVDAMRRAGVLIGRTGPKDDVLKIRPPLIFDREHVDVLVDALERSL